LNQDQCPQVRTAGYATSSLLPPKVQDYVLEKAKVCQPDNIHICDGSEAENQALLQKMQKQGQVTPVKGKYNNW
jgi:phosphoenolpyruvate carboxykinase (GTP)